jgi:CheY-like chemotaxis protein
VGTARQVLLVEDDEAIRQLLRILLTEEDGREVAVAEDGADALRRARERPPDVVVLEMRLPRVDGHQVARELRADPSTSDAWIVAISAEGGADAARLAGCDDFLAKPLDVARLEESVQRGFARAAARGVLAAAEGAAAT